ncbi:hypothetical protein IWW36_001271 [Coemansia brasiliensis]|uniref:DEK-C domain-containing protein n=1 Tax=Coemansia brasiliensis TaxID=2650707 RepID=A0A9W8M1Q6_9FUNG|nr:hypothetical protein IWW36_001271 [Coemansia brasiliensis]
MEDIDIDKLKQTCRQIVQEGDLDALTNKVVRRSAEKRLELNEKSLDQEPYKSLVKETVELVLSKLEQGTKSGNEDSRMNTEESEANANANTNGKQSDIESAADDGSDSQDKDDEEDEFSDDIDEEPPTATKKKKRNSEDSLQPAAKRSRPTKVSKASDTTIANLKSYIGKCGVRKVWSKELAGMNAAQQVRHLKSMLVDIGMVGRPTLEKCKKIKAKRDLQAELDAMNTENIIDEENAPASRSARSRRSAARNVSYNADHVSDSEEEEDAAPESPNEDEEDEVEEEDSEFTADSDSNKEEDVQDAAGASASEEDSD